MTSLNDKLEKLRIEGRDICPLLLYLQVGTECIFLQCQNLTQSSKNMGNHFRTFFPFTNQVRPRIFSFVLYWKDTLQEKESSWSPSV